MHLKHPSFLICLSILAILLATSGCGKGSKESDEVRPVLVTITGDTTNTAVGSEIKLTATLTYSDNTRELVTEKTNWKSSDVDVASIVTGGVATCIGVGTSTLTASYEEFLGTLVISCLPKPYIKTLTFTQDITNIDEGRPLRYSAEAILSNDDPINVTFIWSIDNPELASIDKNGIILGISNGEAIISLTIDEESTDSPINLDENPITRKITINPITNAISISKTESPADDDIIYNLELGETAHIQALNHKTDGTSTTITRKIAEWLHETPGVISIDYLGDIIRTKALGTTEISIHSYRVISNGYYNELKSNNKATVYVEKPLELHITHDTAAQIKLNWYPTIFDTGLYQINWKTTDEAVFHELYITETEYIHTISDTSKTYEYKIGYRKADGSFSNMDKTLIQVKPHLSTWQKKNDFPARAHASSTIIGDKIYVFGGEITTTDTTFTTNEVWEYTISTHHWEAKATMATARQNAASCTVNGYVFLFGGYNVETSEVLSDIAAFHPTSGLSPGITFDNITLPPLKGASCATDGSILYVSGGTTDNVNISNKIYRFEITLDGINDTLTQLADVIDLPLNMSVARYKHQSIISNNQLYIAGGLTTNDVVTPTLEILDLATLQWLPAENITEMDIARYNFSLNIIGDRIYATGGQDSPGNLLNSVEILDPTKDLKTWITGDAMPFKNAAFISEYQPSSETMYLFGGTNSAFVDSNGNSNQMLYSGTNLSWHPLLNTADGIYDTSAGHIGDYVYLIGGREENGTISNKTQTYSISQNSWVTATNGPAPLKTARVNATTVSTNGLIFAIGGIGTVNNEETYLSSMEIYGLDNAPNNWNDGFSEIKYPRANACAIFDKGFIYLIGGENDVGFVKTIERFNPATNEWAEYDTLSKPRAGHSCAIIKGSIYLIGGYLDYATKKAEQIVDTYTPSTTSGKGVFDYTKTSFNQAGIIKPAVSVFNDRIYMFGGITGKLLSYQGTTISEKYTPFTDSWKDLESVPAPTELPLIETPPSNNPYSVVVGNKIYVFANNHILTSLEGDITATRRNSTNIYVLE